MALNLEDVIWPNGQNNDGGVATDMYYARLSDFATLQDVAASPTDFGEKVTIDGTHTFNTGKCFKKIRVTLERGQIQSEMQGERNSKSFRNVGTFGFPGQKAEALGFVEEVKNDDLIVLMVEMDGQVRQLGNALAPAHFDTVDSTTGMATADFKGMNSTIHSVGRIAPIYAGTITLTPAA